MKKRQIVAIKGAGDLASGIAVRLWRCGFRVILSELPVPLCIRRSIAFASAVFDGVDSVEEVSGVLIQEASEAETAWAADKLPVIVDPDASKTLSLRPDVLIDARIIKTWREDTHLSDAPLVLGLGPGFIAGKNCHAVIETNRGHDMGRVLWTGEAEADTGVPGTIKGEGIRRVVKSPGDGKFVSFVEIGDFVHEGDRIASAGDEVIFAQLSGIVRGVIYPGIMVQKGLKIMDIDPRGVLKNCFTVSDKANALAGGVLEAILSRF